MIESGIPSSSVSTVSSGVAGAVSGGAGVSSDVPEPPPQATSKHALVIIVMSAFNVEGPNPGQS